jgi:ribosomal protein S18 acetylase RimI-like enzyme
MAQIDLTIRAFAEGDWPAAWAILQAAFQGGDSLAYPPETPEDEARHSWIEAPRAVYVACSPAGEVLGLYFLKANQPGLGDHVANAGYVVSPAAAGRGVASAMCSHSQREALRLGFRAMQFNFVVSTNAGAVHVWRKHGFEIVGTLPGAFRHLRLGEVDAYVMYKRLGQVE